MCVYVGGDCVKQFCTDNVLCVLSGLQFFAEKEAAIVSKKV